MIHSLSPQSIPGLEGRVCPWMVNSSLAEPSLSQCIDTLLNNTVCTANFCIFLRQCVHIPNRQNCPVAHLCLYYRQWSTAACMHQYVWLCHVRSIRS